MRDLDINRFIRPHLVSAPTYAAMDPPEVLAQKAGIAEDQIIKLNGNENPYGASPKAVEAVKNIPLHIYPDPMQIRIRNSLSKYTKMPPEYIVAGAGADELIDLIFRLFISPGDQILDFEPTFGMYSFGAKLAGGGIKFVQRDEKFDLDVQEAKKNYDNQTKIVFVTSPNNPTGNVASRSDIEELLSLDLIVVVDEAYYEFSGRTVQELTKRYKNLIVLRTMSKWAGLAGLRVGYGIMHPDIARYIMEIKPPYNVNVAGEAALIASLEDSEYLLSNVKLIIDERERLYRLLLKIPGVTPWPSEGNYILCEFAENEAERVYEGLASKGIFVRSFGSSRLKDFFRIAIGTPEQTDILIEKMKELV